jgi:hypothetical protein
MSMPGSIFRLSTFRSSIHRLSGSPLSIMRFCKRLVGRHHAAAGHAAPLRHAVAWIFIALVALFLTHPADGPADASAFTVPWPAELGLDGALVGGTGG